MHEGRRIASKTPTFLSGLMAYTGEPQHAKSRNARSFASCRTRSCNAACRTHIGGGTMPKQHVIFDEGSVETVERLRKQDEEFCRRLRVAVEMGNEFCPTTVITAPCTSRPILNYMRTD